MRIDEKLPSHGHLRATEGQIRTGLADTPPPPGRIRRRRAGRPGRPGAGTILALDPANRI